VLGCGPDSIRLGPPRVMVLCEHSNELLGFTDAWNFLSSRVADISRRTLLRGIIQFTYFTVLRMSFLTWCLSFMTHE
jgi:hypothetical protein